VCVCVLLQVHIHAEIKQNVCEIKQMFHATFILFYLRCVDVCISQVKKPQESFILFHVRCVDSFISAVNLELTLILLHYH